jgi:peptide/nickel transport system substrate-binding protein
VALDNNMVPVPGIATWTVSDDGLEYSFNLREGVRFHSGDPLTAADVKFTLDRWLANDASPTRYTVNSITEVEVIDDLTVVLRLDQPYVLLLASLAAPYASVLNANFVEQHGEGYGTSPETTDGSGPFRLTEWVRQDRMVLERNDEYTWGPEAFENRGPAHFAWVVWRLIPEDSTRIAELEAGNVQFTANIPELEVDILEMSPTVQIIRYEDPNTTFIGFKLEKAPLDDIRVRRAINHALDRDELVFGAFGGLANPAHSPVSSLLPFASDRATESGYRFDRELAEELLTEAGWVDTDGDGVRQKDGQDLEILWMYSPFTFTDNLIPLVQEQLAAVGIRVTPRQLEWTAYLAALRAGEHEMMLMSIRYINEDGIMYFYFNSEQRPAPNRFDFVDYDVDEWLEIGRTSLDDAARAEAYENIQLRVIDSAVFAPVAHQLRAVGASRDVSVAVHPYYVLYKLLDTHFVQ